MRRWIPLLCVAWVFVAPALAHGLLLWLGFLVGEPASVGTKWFFIGATAVGAIASIPLVNMGIDDAVAALERGSK